MKKRFHEHSKYRRKKTSYLKSRDEEKSNLWSDHINNLAQYIFKENRFLGHALHSMQLLLIKKLQFIPCQNSISIQIYALEPDKDSIVSETHSYCTANDINTIKRSKVYKYIHNKMIKTPMKMTKEKENSAPMFHLDVYCCITNELQLTAKV